MKLMNKLFMILAMVAIGNLALAQDYTLEINSGTIKFDEIRRLVIKGHNGSGVIFSSSNGSTIPERAEGLRPINSLGLQDNTGIGLSINDTNGEYVVREVLRNTGTFTVQVPKNVQIQVIQESVHSNKIEIEDVPNDIEVSSRYGKVKLRNVSGSTLVNSVHGEVVAEFTTANKPISIIAIHASVDVTLPASTKAKVKLSSKYGDLFTDMNIEYDTGGNDMRKITSVVEGTLNGGGTEIYLQSTHRNVYLRKK